MAELVKDLVPVLREGGPWALLIILGIAYWRKDKKLQEVYEQQQVQAQAQTTQQVEEAKKTTAALVAFKASLDGLKATLDAFLNRLP